ncbi:iron-sulfur cluster assembly protein, partial [Acidithiobacillus ferridurans]|nr:iron-sulfur cluster assembly protein [Acidithiobacillus ferridurans]
MTGLTREQVEQSLRAVQDPYLGKDLAAAGVLKGVDDSVVKLELPYPSLGVAISLSEEVARQIRNDHGISAQVTVGHRILSHQVQRG